MTRLLMIPVAFVLIAAAPAGDDGQTTRTRPSDNFDGTWKLLAADVDGEPKSAKELAGYTVTIDSRHGKIDFQRDGIVEFFQFDFEIVPASQAVIVDGLVRGTYRWQGERLEIQFGRFAASERTRLLLYRTR